MAKNAPLDDHDREDLVAYLDGEADKKTARKVEEKLSVNPEARKEAEALKRAWDMLDYLPRPEPSPNFTNRTMERVTGKIPGVQRKERHWRPWLLGLGWAASMLIAAYTGFGATALYVKHIHAKLDQQLVRDLHTVENLRAYEHVDDIDFLHKLANPNDPDLFGEEHGLGS